MDKEVTMYTADGLDILYHSGMISEEEYLAHHGILGQKWGIRRYQNPDGTLTAEGKARVKSEYTKQFESFSSKEARSRMAAEEQYKINRLERKKDKKGLTEKQQAKLNRLINTVNLRLTNLDHTTVDLGKEYMSIINNSQKIQYASSLLWGPIGSAIVGGVIGTAAYIDTNGLRAKAKTAEERIEEKKRVKYYD